MNYRHVIQDVPQVPWEKKTETSREQLGSQWRCCGNRHSGQVPVKVRKEGPRCSEAAGGVNPAVHLHQKMKACGRAHT